MTRTAGKIVSETENWMRERVGRFIWNRQLAKYEMKMISRNAQSSINETKINDQKYYKNQEINLKYIE
jgi:hypothetical protein